MTRAARLHALPCQVGRWINAAGLSSIVHITCDSKARSGAVQAVVALTDKGQAQDLYEYVFPWWVPVRPAATAPNNTAGAATAAATTSPQEQRQTTKHRRRGVTGSCQRGETGSAAACGAGDQRRQGKEALSGAARNFGSGRGGGGRGRGRRRQGDRQQQRAAAPARALPTQVDQEVDRRGGRFVSLRWWR